MMKYCKHCGAELRVRQSKRTPQQLKKPYYFTHYYLCPTCGRLYHDNTFKVMNDNYDLFTDPTTLSQEPFDVDIWTDGACTNNGKTNAKAAWGFVSGDYEEAGLVDGKQTNNRGEALAIYHALKWAVKKGYRKIRLHSDSQITLHGVIKHPERVKENRDIFQKIHDVVTENNLIIDYQKVLGHSGDPNNDRADKVATSILS